VASSIAKIFERVQTSPAESLILQTLAHKSNIQGQNARMSYEALAASTDFSERWCKELVRRLEEKHLLRVQRLWLAPGKCAINRYDLVCPWRRELTYREALDRKSTTAHFSGEGFQHPYPTQRENKEPAGACSHEMCLKAGLTEGSEAYLAARGLPPTEEPSG